MAFQPAPNMAEAVYIGERNGKNPLSVLNFLFVPGAYTQTDIDTLADAIDQWMVGEILPIMPSETAYVRTDVRGLSVVNDLFASNNNGAGVGALGGENLSSNVTWAVKFTSGLTGRSARGRNFVWFLDSTAQDTNEDFITTARANAIVAAYAEIPTYIGGSGWAHIILSRFTAGAPRAAGVAFLVSNYSFTDLKLDTQRRRIS